MNVTAVAITLLNSYFVFADKKFVATFFYKLCKVYKMNKIVQPVFAISFFQFHFLKKNHTAKSGHKSKTILFG
jgi:hypothetical protein